MRALFKGLLTTLTLITFIPPVYAGAEPESAKSFVNWEFSVFTHQQESCLSKLINHPLTKNLYPDLLQMNNPQGEQLLKEIDSFCVCKATKAMPSQALKKEDPIAYHFRDKSGGYGQEDLCASMHLSKASLSLNYAITVTTSFHNEVADRLEQRTPASVKWFASENTYQNHLQCMHEMIMNRCTKTKSLQHTYNCILETSTDQNVVDSFLSYCPDLGGNLPTITENSTTYPRI